MITTLIKQLSDFTYRNGFEISNVFDDFLRYIIWAHTLPDYGKKIEDWLYTPEQSKEFFTMYQTLILSLQEELKHKEWFDIFGTIYEDLIASKSRRGNMGQFFTPMSLCDLMVDLTQPNNDNKIIGKRINDCACGSGRTLLAFNSKFPGNYYIAEDVDKTCAMMCVCNFILHGMKGEVIWHNSLMPENFFGAWKINEQLNNPFKQWSCIPHCREIGIKETTLPFSNTTDVNIVRIKEKLQASADKVLARLHSLVSSNIPSHEYKSQARALTMKYKQIKKLIKRYDDKN